MTFAGRGSAAWELVASAPAATLAAIRHSATALWRMRAFKGCVNPALMPPTSCLPACTATGAGGVAPPTRFPAKCDGIGTWEAESSAGVAAGIGAQRTSSVPRIPGWMLQ